MKLHYFGEMRKKIADGVVAWIRVVFMFDVFVGEFTVQRRRSLFKSIVVFLATVKVDREFRDPTGISFRQQKGIIVTPVPLGDGVAKDRTQRCQQRGPRVRSRIELPGSFRDQCCALRARRGKKLRTRERKPKCPVPTHRNSGDCPSGSPTMNPILALNSRHEFL